MIRRALDRLRPTAMLAMLLVAAAGCGPSSPRTSPGPDEGNRTSDGAVGVSTADENDFRNARVTRAEELLEGRFPGVQVIRQPGGILVRIRGATSLNGSNEPLYILDGMPIDGGSGGALIGVNPSDIAKIEVLKDIAATSMYGVRGANGVVVITTKRN